MQISASLILDEKDILSGIPKIFIKKSGWRQLAIQYNLTFMLKTLGS